MSRLTSMFSLIFLLLPACANFGDQASNIFFPKTDNSFERKGETVRLDFGYRYPGDPPSRPKPIPGTATSGIRQHAVGTAEIAAAAGFIVEQISEYLKKESERYTATYSAVAVGDQFYSDWTPDGSVNLQTITLNRTVESGNAVKISFAVIPTKDGTAFRLKPSYVHLERAKAKLASFALLDPVSWFSSADKDLDLTVNLKMHAVWRDEQLKVHVQDLAEGEFQIRNVKLNDQYGGNGTPPVPGGDFNGKLFPMPARSFLGETLGKEEYRLLNLQGLNEQVASAIPPNKITLEDWRRKSFADQLKELNLEVTMSPSGEEAPSGMQWYKLRGQTPVLGLGNFVVTILVTEYDDYGKKVKETSEQVGKQKEDVVKAVKKALGEK
ncbi:hypothetical protein [Candidatus Nitrospira nitrificans]|uniref:Lipoprotein n=1 Tax=Candidatus Nitrospira nitrificans TaxID=1742973 RepID=A0A0S4L8A5_9BACT|nr:hypothetical protein [Candidatus Nitrospira nitrificans]CUS32845.1 exported hypothetical protein [Candidatus Nitrospira nitrificans]